MKTRFNSRGEKIEESMLDLGMVHSCMSCVRCCYVIGAKAESVWVVVN